MPKVVAGNPPTEERQKKTLAKYFEMIIGAYSKAPKIVLFLDNAKYFKAQIVRDWLKEHTKLQFEFLPPYAPNLNLNERLWDFEKKLSKINIVQNRTKSC